MKNYFLIILLTLCAQMAQGADTKLKVVVKGDLSFVPTFDCGFGKQLISYDPITGMGEVSFDLKSPMTIVLEPVKNVYKTIYLSVGAEVMVNIDNSFKPAVVTYSGGNAKENDFINNNKIYSHKAIDSKRKKDIKEISRFTDSMLMVNISELKKVSGLSKEFLSFEANSLKARSYSRFLRECFVSDTNSDLYMSELLKRVTDDELTVSSHDYRSFVKDAMKRITAIENPRIKDSERTKVIVETAIREVKNRETIAYIVDAYATPHIAFVGTAGADYFIDMFNKYVTDPARKENFKRIRALSEVVDKGKPCPDFTFSDVNDKPVSLADLRGKFVFIDLWATWCGPCKAEIPYVQQLEEQFHGKDLLFVSISVDKNKDIQVWKDLVREKKMGGIQLILGENWNWIKNFMPASLSVPRFILLDRDGKILDPNMSRPSDPNTSKTLNNILL